MSRLPDPGNPRQQAFLRAAAVLWQFEPDALQPDDGDRARPGEAASLVLPFVARLRGAGRDRWTLRDALRPALLRGADATELARLRARNATTDGREQQLVDRWLAGPDPALAAYDLEALAVLSRMVTWLEPMPPHFPSIDHLDRLRAEARVRAPLLALAGKGVRGRAGELGRLHSFVEGEPTADAPAILVVHGIGGVGKSTLTAQLLLDVLASGDPSHLVAYLDFDHPTLDARDGLTLILEILTQGATQLPDPECLRSLVRRASQATIDLSAGRGRAPGRALAVQASMAELAASSGLALRAAGASRVTLVLDTFEGTQYADPEHQRHLVDQLDVLHANLPGLHTIVISRAMLALPGAGQLELKDLDRGAARRLLGDHGVRDEALVDATLQAARGNPLGLQLAAQAIATSAAARPAEGGTLDARAHQPGHAVDQAVDQALDHPRDETKLATQLGDHSSLARLEAARSPRAPGVPGASGSASSGVAQAEPRGARPGLAEVAPSPVQWLDDQELRSVIEAAIAGTDGATAAAVPSTRAASAYAKAVQLNRRVEDKDTSADLFDWVDALSKSHRDLEAICGNLKARLSIK